MHTEDTAAIRINGLAEVRRLLATVQGELPTVNRYAQNKLAYEIWAGEKGQMRADIDRPTPFSLGSIVYKKFGESTINIRGAGFSVSAAVESAGVFVIDRIGREGATGSDYLGVMIRGGKTAGPKRSEVRLAPFTPRDHVWVPSRWAKLDRYGNISGATWSAIITALGMNDSARPKQMNWKLIGAREGVRGYRGIAKKVGRRWVPWVWFVPRQQYQPQYDFYGRADQEVRERWEGIFAFYLDKALEKAR